MKELYKQVKRLVIGVIGFNVLLIGVVMIVLPGPSLLVILLGLGILATEFIWARRLLKKVRGTVSKQMGDMARWVRPGDKDKGDRARIGHEKEFEE